MDEYPTFASPFCWDNSTLHIQGTGSKGRSLPLTPYAQHALTVYLKQYRLRAGKPDAHDPFFLSEQRGRLTPNAFTLLFHRLCTRAGLEDHPITPSMLRDMGGKASFVPGILEQDSKTEQVLK